MKVYSYSLIILLTIILTSCNNSNKVKNPAQIKKELQGLWLLEDSVGEEIKHFTLYFNDAVCHIYYNQSNSNHYQINDSMLELKITTSSSIIGNQVRFKICKIDKQILHLLPLSSNLKKYCKNEKIDTLKLFKAKKQNYLDYRLVTLGSSGCYGTCPVFNFQIDQSKNILFNGEHYVSKEGTFKARSDDQFYKILIDKLQYVDFKKLKSEYEASWTDDLTIGFIVETKNKLYQTRVYGTDKEPIELRSVFGYIFSNYEQFDFVKSDETLKYDSILFGMGVPPIEETIKFIPPEVK